MNVESDRRISDLEQKTRDFPDEIRFQVSLGREYLGDGRAVEAEACARSAVVKEPGYAPGHFLLVDILQQQRRLGSANEAIDRALQVLDEKPELLARAGEIRHLAGRLPEAEAFLVQGLEQSPGNTRMRFQYARLLLDLCRYDEALELFTALSQGRFFREEAFAGIAHVHERRGDLDSAREYIDRALVDNRNPGVFVLQTLADIACQTGEFRSAIEIVGAGEGKSGLSGEERAALHFSLGNMLDKTGEYGKAFAHYKTANDLLAPDYDWRTMGDICRELAEIYSFDAVKKMPVSTAGSDRPVFVVGLPRTGTSLVERILAAHPQVHGAGELENIRLIAGEIGRNAGVSVIGPDDIKSLGTAQLNSYAMRYLDKLDSLSPDARRIVDKMPGNLLYLGLVSALFPDARVIHCVRNPLDTCLSSYFQRFNSSRLLAYTFSLEALAYTWQQQEKLMAHWKSVLPNPVMDVAYEDLVDRFEDVAHALLDFCGLEWSDSVRVFHEADSNCHTASYYQVRRPVYRSSINRWRNYEPYIQQLIEALA